MPPPSYQIDEGARSSAGQAVLPLLAAGVQPWDKNQSSLRRGIALSVQQPLAMPRRSPNGSAQAFGGDWERQRHSSCANGWVASRPQS
ncbi:hypothetical protein ColLi_04474 [Colletotrichum liriopes]|uniref:Uncharacterized protein n=1 Tax=Colletotrichum liriopes TaxID=708192 RepID=A0AA37GJR9_9PEZI|nr:hypothetical protein ColLi_04474 [Colletotrichum liriopes]